MLEHLHALGYRFKMAHHSIVDAVKLPPVGKWRHTRGFDRLSNFPSNGAYQRAARNGRSPMREAYDSDFVTFSTNLFAYRVNWNWTAAVAPWPTLGC